MGFVERDPDLIKLARLSGSSPAHAPAVPQAQGRPAVIFWIAMARNGVCAAET